MRRARLWPLVAVGLLAACSSETTPTAGGEFPDSDADQVMVDAEYFVTADGVRQAMLLADTAFMFNGESRVELRGVHLTLFHATGEEAAVLTSLTGELDTRTDAMIARGNVVLVAHDGGRRIETEELNYHPQRDRIWSDVATTLHEDGTVAHGTGFTSDAQLRNIKVLQPSGEFEGLEFSF